MAGSTRLNPRQSIKSWSRSDRPREKLLEKSKKALTDAELLAIVIGSGTAERSALDLARDILASSGQSLAECAGLGVSQLLRFKGIGEARAAHMVAAFELGQRMRMSQSPKKPVIMSSRDAFELMYPLVGDLPHEEFWIMTLNRGHGVRRTVCISQGSVSGTVADPKKIFKLALEDNASALILCHNHPSGRVQPSTNDNQITTKCRKSGAFLDLPVLDHLIIAGEQYFSYADEGLL